MKTYNVILSEFIKDMVDKGSDFILLEGLKSIIDVMSKRESFADVKEYIGALSDSYCDLVSEITDADGRDDTNEDIHQR